MKSTAITIQDRLDYQELSSHLEKAIDALSNGDGERGAVFTRKEVVNFILDLCGYVPDKKLFELRLLEPSFGGGDFLTEVIDRLITSWKLHNAGIPPSSADLASSLYAVELHSKTFQETKNRVIAQLKANGISVSHARSLAASWLHQGDFLLQKIEVGFNFVVGNPPYVRQESIPSELIAEYRRLYKTVFDRADLYIPFIERSLSLLLPEGLLSFICSDRWTKNRYGGPLRELVSEQFHLKYFVDMVNTASFHSDVIAYPGIFVISKSTGVRTKVAHRPEVTAPSLNSLSQRLRDDFLRDDQGIKVVTQVARGSEPWILDSLDSLAVVRRIENTYPAIEDTGCAVRIGVATGADKVFVAMLEDLNVEKSRKLPLVMTRDIVSGDVNWRGFGVLNPFEVDGRLASLDDYPRFAKYLQKHGTAIRDRHVATKNPNGWYRTIDRIYPDLAAVPKLLIPDIKGQAHVVYEGGGLYPHHNLYFITSSKWNLRALQAVLLSNLTRAVISAYSTKMRGGYLRYQAQYLRRIRLPRWSDVPKQLQKDLASAASARDVNACDDLVRTLYNLTHTESQILRKQPES